MAADDLTTAERLAHSLKGVAGVIGAEILEARAKQVESACRERLDQAQIEPLLQSAAVELNRLCEAVAQVISSASPEVTSQPATLSESTEQVERRNQLLRKGAKELAIFDAEVENTLAALRECALSPAMLTWVVQLEQQVAQYDFDGAATILGRCAESLGLDLQSDA